MNKKKQNINNKKREVVIVGGGIVGILMALSLEKLGRSITLISAENLSIENIAKKKNNHSIALSYVSISILNKIGIFNNINKMEKIYKIYISNLDDNYNISLSSIEENIPFLGAVIKINELLYNLIILLKKTNIELLHDKVIDVIKINNSFAIKLEKNNIIEGKLIISADGSNSLLRQKMFIDTYIYDYQQYAIIFDVFLENDHHNYAYESFFNEGLIAILPINNNRVSSIICLNKLTIYKNKLMHKEGLLYFIKNTLSSVLVNFIDISDPYIVPLYLIKPKYLYKKNILLFGNASHTLHPVAGQGLNLSIRDLGILYELIADDKSLNDHYVDKLLKIYNQIRHFDHKQTIWITHALVTFYFKKNFFCKKRFSDFLFYIFQNNNILKKILSEIMSGKFSHGYGSILMNRLYNHDI